MHPSHVAIYCSWVRHLNSTRSRIGARLLRALALRIRALHASPLTAHSVAGKHNTMADVSSRTFHHTTARGPTFTISDLAFLTSFAARFALPQPLSWRMLRLSTKVTSAVLSELQTTPSTMASWLRLSAKGNAIGVFGPPSAHPSLLWTPIFPTQAPLRDSTLSSVSLTGSGQVVSLPVAQSALNRSKSRFVPLARPSNWLDNPTPRTHRLGGSTAASNGNLNTTRAKTPLL